MSVKFRIDKVRLDTINGPVAYNFSGPLTVLTGPVGSGKSTLFELIKYCFGAKAVLSPVVDQSINSASVEISTSGDRLRLTRLISGSNVDVFDLEEHRQIGEYPVASKDSAGETIGKFLLAKLGLPVDAKATAMKASQSTKSPAVISFSDIYKYLYVDQQQIDRTIAGNNESYLEPKRRTTFEILFGLTSEELIRARSDLQDTEQNLRRVGNDLKTVLQFLEDSKTVSRDASQAKLNELQSVANDSQSRLMALQEGLSSADDRVDPIRDLLEASQYRAEDARKQLVELDTTLGDRRSLLASVRQSIRRLERTSDAFLRLASIEFSTCPRCTQSIEERDIEPGHCRLCTQPEPEVDSSSTTAGHLASSEVEQLRVQADELEQLVTTAEHHRASLTSRISDLDTHIVELANLVDARTADLVSPRLQEAIDLSASLARAQAEIKSLDDTLRLWDRAGDLERNVKSVTDQRDALKARIAEIQKQVKEKFEIVDSMAEDYNDTLQRLGVPSVTAGTIDKKNYLPMADGMRFDQISTGGIRTALIVAYWVTLISTALREPETGYPGLLILDTPRKSIGHGENLAANLYRLLDTLAEVYGDRVQLIIADNDLPDQYSRRWQEIYFDYENPVVSTIPHPGPSRVVTLDKLQTSTV
ncbi:AAA family ATPase [Amycolatopsis sp. CA-161197]|uniref:ATP-binding protein n=1 Tax=Amycolatopsis sp. CA-161197 TaxID=3239922 RepID=UPI003D92D8BB